MAMKLEDKKAIIKRLKDPATKYTSGTFAVHVAGEDCFCALGVVLDECGTGVWLYYPHDCLDNATSRNGGWVYETDEPLGAYAEAYAILTGESASTYLGGTSLVSKVYCASDQSRRRNFDEALAIIEALPAA